MSKRRQEWKVNFEVFSSTAPRSNLHELKANGQDPKEKLISYHYSFAPPPKDMGNNEFIKQCLLYIDQTV